MRAVAQGTFTIAFLQCQIVKELPHMNMPLFVHDIHELGCTFECICASRSRLEDLTTYLKHKHFDLFALDYTFPITFLNQLKGLFPKSKFVIGGHGFLDTFLKSRVDFAVLGAGRQSFLELVKALKDNGDITKIPNLFFKTKQNNAIVIDYSGKNICFDLKRELFPYQPFLRWRYVGFTRRDRISDPPAIVAEFGCPYRSKKLNRLYDNVPLVMPEGLIFSPAAKKRISALFRERMGGGCSFCTCMNAHVFLPIEETVDCLMGQIRFLQKVYGFTGFVVGSEYPFRFIVQLINRLIQENISLGLLALRSRADWVNKNKRVLFQVVGLAQKHDFVVSLQQLGFESYLQSDLDVYNKGYKVAENFKAVELIRELHAVAPNNFQDGGHGFIGINPWITMRELAQYSRSAGTMQFLFDQFRFGNGLILYDSCLPIYQKLKKDGLLIESKTDLARWKFKDKNVARYMRK
ncbi:MAG TPA: hypothetical protein PKL77_00070 [Candidatus Omnitrophota bacterium]|nr:hypothetical protein [Candidatus Omnitrophota bacterium]HPT06683.1 hypothetical protein [Candidatus Omnitrophota bacterium]